MTSTTVTRGATTGATAAGTRRRRLTPARVLLHVFLVATERKSVV